MPKVIKPKVQTSKKPTTRDISDEESVGGYDSGNSSSSDYKVETRKRVLKLKEKKKKGAEKSKPPAP